MVDYVNSAEGNADGTVVTTATSASGGNPFETVAGSPTFSTEQAAFGASSFKYSGAAAAAANLTRWAPSGAATPTLRFSGYVRLLALPGSSTCAITQFRTASAAIASILVTQAGGLQFLDSASGGSTALMTVAAGTWYFITAKVTRGTTTSNGVMTIEVYDEEGGTLLASYTNAARNLGTADLAAVQFGRLTSAAAATLYWDQVRFSTDDGPLYAPWVEEFPSPIRRFDEATDSYVYLNALRWNGAEYVPVESI